jgi:hypothetical protein
MVIGPDGDEYPELVRLADGTLFPQRLGGIIAYYEGGPYFEAVVEVRNGQPGVARLTTTTMLGEPLISDSSMREPNYGSIFQRIIEASSEYALTIATRTTQGPDANPSQAELNLTRKNAAAAGRRRPIPRETLERAAEIARTNRFSPCKQISQELGYERRQASRILALVRKLGMVDVSEMD